MDKEREKLLVERALENPEAFQELYDYFFPKIYAYIGYRIDRVEDVEDLVAETFLKVVTNLVAFQWRGNGSFGAWLFRIAHNLVSNFYRQCKQSDNLISLEEMPKLEASAPLPEDITLQKEKAVFLKKLIRNLSERRQEIIILKFFGCLRNNEIAEILELDERTVASHLCRGLDDLHRLYMEQLINTEG